MVHRSSSEAGGVAGRAAAILAAGALALAAVLAVGAVRLPDRQLQPPPPSRLDVDAAGAAARLAAALTAPTISHQDPARFDRAAFARLNRMLTKGYPAFHAAATWQTLPGGSRLYRWEGRRPDLPPVVLLAHTDVVPADAGEWTHPPFAGRITEGYIWGRGALDDKGAVVAILEAAEGLAAAGHVPGRDLYLAFGHDEEVGGEAGAKVMAERLAADFARRELQAHLVLDEGLTITEGMVPGIDRPVALIGVAEKGYLTVGLSATAPSGHSSMPPADGAVGRIARALARLDASPLEPSLEGPVGDFLRWAGPGLGLPGRLVAGNLWLFGPLVKRVLAAKPPTNALIRTTTALTMVHGGVKENVLPTAVSAVVNFRIRPGETAAGVLDHVRRTVADPAVAVAPQDGMGSEPSPVSPAEGPAFAALHRSILQIAPDAVVAPNLVVGATDARHYTNLGPRVYRFAPWRLGPDDVPRIHGIDERIAVEDFADAVRFYHHLIVNTTS